MKKPVYLFLTIAAGIVFFGAMFTLIRTFYYHTVPALREYVFPLAMGIIFGGGIGAWRIQTISYRKELEQSAFELRIANTELKRKNKILTDTREKLKQSEKMETIGLLAGGVAHDLNNILAGIIVYPEIMLRDLPEESPMVSRLQKIRKSGEKAAAILQDLLTLARRRIRVDQPVDLKAIVTQYLSSPECDRLRHFHPTVTIETDIREALPLVKGSSTHLYKAVMNLVSNATEAIPAEGGTVRISIEKRYVDHHIQNYEETPEGDYVILTVSDTGHGIAPRDLQRIFEPFFTKKKMGRSGTGLGMTVVWGTVRDHGGYIEVESDTGEGSRFCIYLPAAPDTDEIEREQPFVLEDHTGENQLVLIVDDLEEQRDILSAIIRRLGYRDHAVASGEEAVEFLRHQHADLMILNYFLGPGMSGPETYRRAVSCRPDIRAVSTSGYLSPETIRELTDAGISEHLQKPLTLKNVARALTRELVR